MLLLSNSLIHSQNSIISTTDFSLESIDSVLPQKQHIKFAKEALSTEHYFRIDTQGNNKNKGHLRFRLYRHQSNEGGSCIFYIRGNNKGESPKYNEYYIKDLAFQTDSEYWEEMEVRVSCSGDSEVLLIYNFFMENSFKESPKVEYIGTSSATKTFKITYLELDSNIRDPSIFVRLFESRGRGNAYHELEAKEERAEGSNFYKVNPNDLSFSVPSSIRVHGFYSIELVFVDNSCNLVGAVEEERERYDEVWMDDGTKGEESTDEDHRRLYLTEIPEKFSLPARTSVVLMLPEAQKDTKSYILSFHFPGFRETQFYIGKGENRTAVPQVKGRDELLVVPSSSTRLVLTSVSTYSEISFVAYVKLSTQAKPRIPSFDSHPGIVSVSTSQIGVKILNWKPSFATTSYTESMSFVFLSFKESNKPTDTVYDFYSDLTKDGIYTIVGGTSYTPVISEVLPAGEYSIYAVSIEGSTGHRSIYSSPLNFTLVDIEHKPLEAQEIHKLDTTSSQIIFLSTDITSSKLILAFYKKDDQGSCQITFLSSEYSDNSFTTNKNRVVRVFLNKKPQNNIPLKIVCSENVQHVYFSYVYTNDPHNDSDYSLSETRKSSVSLIHIKKLNSNGELEFQVNIGEKYLAPYINKEEVKYLAYYEPTKAFRGYNAYDFIVKRKYEHISNGKLSLSIKGNTEYTVVIIAQHKDLNIIDFYNPTTFSTAQIETLGPDTKVEKDKLIRIGFYFTKEKRSSGDVTRIIADGLQYYSFNELYNQDNYFTVGVLHKANDELPLSLSYNDITNEKRVCKDDCVTKKMFNEEGGNYFYLNKVLEFKAQYTLEIFTLDLKKQLPVAYNEVTFTVDDSKTEEVIEGNNAKEDDLSIGGFYSWIWMILYYILIVVGAFIAVFLVLFVVAFVIRIICMLMDCCRRKNKKVMANKEN